MKTIDVLNAMNDVYDIQYGGEVSTREDRGTDFLQHIWPGAAGYLVGILTVLEDLDKFNNLDLYLEDFYFEYWEGYSFTQGVDNYRQLVKDTASAVLEKLNIK